MDALEPSSESSQQKSRVALSPPVPEEIATPMPVQNLRGWTGKPLFETAPYPWQASRRFLVFAATLALTGVASHEMYRVISINRITELQIALLVLFTLSFIWIALPCVSGLIGFLSLLGSHRASALSLPAWQPGQPLASRTAILMPIYNEAPQRIFAGLQAIYESLEVQGTLDYFDFFILSDSTNPEVWLEEERGFWELRQRTKGEKRLFYRHRMQNIRRKAGNIADFCQRWGRRYEHMVILDADSLMTGKLLGQLAAAMEANPQAGLIQTLPLLVNRHTLFARAQQFAARIYGPVVATGLAYWHLGDSSYWGHNAIIRTQAFIDHAGLPDLPGRPPLGGPIMSHDFVEAALIRRAGWRLYLFPEPTGSYEESPPSLIDFAERDRRWCQGNLQHSRIVSTAGFYWLSRFHLVMGIMSYLASPIWLLFIILGILLSLQAHFLRPEYFPKQFALFPTWPVFDPVRSLRLFIGTMAVLVAPKLFGFLLLFKYRQMARRCGGMLRVGVSVLLEIMLSSLIAPVMMLMQSSVVVSILTGRDAGWKAQRRDDGSIPLGTIVRRHRPHMLVGIVLAIVAYAVSPSLLAWMSPVVLGLLLAIPVSAATGRQTLGIACRRLGLLVTPEETNPPGVLRRARELTAEWASECSEESDVLARLADDARLRTLHAAMLPAAWRPPKGEYDIDLLVGLAKLDDADTLEEASAMLSSREKFVILGNPTGFERFCHLIQDR